MTAGGRGPAAGGHPGIWVGDLARALVGLGVDPGDYDRVRHIAALLGLRGPVPGPDPAVDRHGTPVPDPAQGGGPAPGTPSRPTRQHDTAPEPRALHDSGAPLLSGQPAQLTMLTPLHGRGGHRPGWRFRALAERAEHPEEAGLPHHPLLPPHSETATLQTVLSRVVPEGEVDTRRLLEEIATGHPLQEFPRLPVRTLRFGTQVLVDLGPGMELFARDQAELVDRITAIVGRHATEVLYFAESPLHRAGPGAGWTWRPYRPPAAGTRVLVLSNFGCHRPGAGLPSALWHEWQELTALLRRSGCLPAAMVPLPPDRYPDRLTPLMPVLSWDRCTTTVHAEARVP